MSNSHGRATTALFGASTLITGDAFRVAAKTGENTVAAKDLMFKPLMLTVEAGTTVSWRNMDGAPHTVVSADGVFRSQTLDHNDTFAFRFGRPGTYRYICSLHPGMMAAIIVRHATPRP
jgi:plastocyanin